jgi:hypothetical protein
MPLKFCWVIREDDPQARQAETAAHISSPGLQAPK